MVKHLFTNRINVMKNILCILIGLFLAIVSATAQAPMLKPIGIKGNRFFQDGKRLQPNKDLQSVLFQARCGTVDQSWRKSKSVQTTGTIIMGIGVGLMGLSLLQQAKGESSAGLLLGGAAIELVGVGFLIPAAKHRKKAVNGYNVVASGGRCGE